MSIRTKREELTSTFMLISDLKRRWSQWFLQKYFSALRVDRLIQHAVINQEGI